MSNTSKIPVAIIGGGPTGLVSSILLSLCDVPHVLFERYPDTSIFPKAVGLNHRTIEIFRQIGIEPHVIQHRAPADIAGRTAWYTSLGPDGKEIASRDAWGGGIHLQDYEAVSPCQCTQLSQISLEPILESRALIQPSWSLSIEFRQRRAIVEVHLKTTALATTHLNQSVLTVPLEGLFKRSNR